MINDFLRPLLIILFANFRNISDSFWGAKQVQFLFGLNLWQKWKMCKHTQKTQNAKCKKHYTDTDKIFVYKIAKVPTKIQSLAYITALCKTLSQKCPHGKVAFPASSCITIDKIIFLYRWKAHWVNDTLWFHLPMALHRILVYMLRISTSNIICNYLIS